MIRFLDSWSERPSTPRRRVSPLGLDFLESRDVPASMSFDTSALVATPAVESTVIDVSTSVDLSSSASRAINNQAFVLALYQDFLHRTGNPNNPGDAGYWIGLLNQGVSPFFVANGIIRSPESYGIMVDQLYVSILGRVSDPGGRSFWVNQFLGGATLESVQSQFFASAEYQNLFPNNVNYIASLYNKLLGRNGSSNEYAFWLNQLNLNGRQFVAFQISNSTEYRTLVVTSYYANILGRSLPPTQAEVSSWVNSGLDLITIQVNFASSPEYQMNA